LAFLLGLTAGAYWALHNSSVQTFVVSKFINQLSEKLDAGISIGKVRVSFFNRVILEDVLLEDQKADTLFYAEKVTAYIDSLKPRNKKIYLNRLVFSESKLKTERDTTGEFNFSFIAKAFESTEKQPMEWEIRCRDFDFFSPKTVLHDKFENRNETYAGHNIQINVSDFFLAEDSVYFEIDQLTLDDNKNFKITELQSVFTSKNSKIELAELNLETSRSNISQSRAIIEFPSEKEDSLQTLQFNFAFADSKVSFYDISQLVPALKGMNQVVEVSGEVYGNIDDLNGRNLILNTGRNTSAKFDFYANGITDPENMYLFVDLKQSQTSFQDLNRIKLPQKWGTGYLTFPESLQDAGIFSYQGNFTGFLTDFVAFGTLTSEMGILTTDLSVRPEQARQVNFRGEVATENFKLGNLFNIKNVNEITFDGSVDGYFNRDDQSVAAAFDGEIVEVDFNQYNYQNIEIDGVLNNRMFDGLIAMNDPNLQFDFLGQINFNPDVPVFDFRVEMQKALPGKLNLSNNFPNSEVAFTMNANFSGDKLDNLSGTIQVENGVYKNRNGEFSLEGMELQSVTSGPVKYLSFTSDFFDVEINGNYHFQNIWNAFQKSMNRYIPAINYEELAGARENKFGYQLDVKNLNELTKVFAPDLTIETPFLLYGRLDSEQSVFELKGSIPGFNTDNLAVRNIFIGNSPQNGNYISKFRFGEILLKNGMKVNNVTVSSQITGNAIDNLIEWGNPDEMHYSGTIKTHADFIRIEGSNFPHVEIEGFPTHIYIADSLWQISPFTVSVDSTLIKMNNFNFFNENQFITIDGTLSEQPSEELTVNFENIDLSHLSTYLNRKLPLEGTLNGTASIRDFYGKRLLFSDLTIDGFNFKDQKIGTVKMANNWDNFESVLNSELTIINNGRESLNASGHYNPETNEMDYDATVENLSVVILESVIRKTFSNFHGDASGKVKIHGSPQKILLNGALHASNAGLTIDYTQVSYVFSDSVYFRGDTIHFDEIAIRDISGNKGTFDGTIVHTNFQNMIYDLNLRSPKIVAINTTPNDNEQFFGKVVANGRLSITGRGKQVNLTGSATTLSGTAVNISLSDESEIERYDFIRFVSTDEEETQEFTFPEENDGDFSLNLTIRATPEARAQLIYNSQIGDVIKAQGEGILVFGMDNEGNITLSGNYTVEQGDYLFTLQNVINKRFTIEQGGTIDWSGDPYDATIDINAVYRLKASLYDLLVNTYDNIYQSQRIPVECKILLTEDLSNPEIDFEIDFPTVEDRLIDEIRQFFNTPEEMNKQILSLVVLGKFYTPEYLRGTYEAQNPNLIGTTASELFSNQLSNWLSQISTNVDVGLNYRPGNQITNDEIELALSTQMFNDRVTINGNIGNNNNPNSTNQSQLVGDFEVNVKLIPSGKLQFKAYNRSNNNLIYETAPYTQGVGFSFTEDYNNFNELLRKMKSLFTRKEEE
jgi:hypothetical protein